jgi:UDP-3-O-[3-hydroxymyristoyl] glucosamine N-acyltransferase
MLLSDVARHGRYAVARDGPFTALGMMADARDGMVVFCEDERHIAACLENEAVAAVITTRSLAAAFPAPLAVGVAEDPRRAFHVLHNHLSDATDFYWRNFATEISAEAQVHPRAFVAQQNVRIGPGTVIEPHATILERCIIGRDVIVRAGATIGTEGFEFKHLRSGEVLAVRHAGGVRLGDRVEIQANCALSRALFGGFTELGEDTKLDNLVHVAHAARVGRRCFIAANAMLAGSVTIGDDVWIGPGSAISNQVTIGDGASVTIGAVVTRNVAAGERVSGNFALPHDRFLAFLRSIR